MSASVRRVAVLAIVMGDQDDPVYVKDLKSSSAGTSEDGGNGEEYLYNFVLHSSLDMVGEKQWQLQNNYLGVVETFREYSVTAWVTTSGAKFLLLHRGLTEASIRNFLKSISHLWARIALNPLQERSEAIASQAFEAKVLHLAARLAA
jgi:hypothetical protein